MARNLIKTYFEKEDKMKKTFIGGLIFLLIGIFTATLPAFAGSQVTSDVIPVPPSVAGLPTITPEPWVQIEPDPAPFLEGPSFDKEGNLFVVSVFDGRIFKITPDKKVSTIFSKKGLMPCGSAVHKDGRLFVVSLTGEVIVMNRDGSNPVYLTAKYQGKPKRPNDLVFDSKGNFYVTDWVGIVPSPTGGIYRFSSDLKTVQPVVENLAAPNGIGLSPEGNVIWVAEMLRNGLLRLQVQKDGLTIAPMVGASYPYYFSGHPGPDGMAVDSKGHVYQAMNFQGRILILRAGIPVANVLVPGRGQGKLIRVTNVAFKPGTDEVYITLSGSGGGWIYKFRGLAKGLTLFSHQ